MYSARTHPLWAISADAAPLPLLTQRRRFQDSSLWQDSCLHEPPERDQQLTGQGYNAQLAQPGTGRLETAPGPGNLDRHGPDMPIARFGAPQFAPGLATLILGRSQAR